MTSSGQRPLLWAAASGTVGAGAALAATVQPAVIGGLLLGLAALTAHRAPRVMPVIVIAACATYLGLYLTYRVQLGSFPLSALDLMPVLAMIAAFSLPRMARRPLLHALHGQVVLPIALLTAGAFIGTLLGLANGAHTYQLVRVDRVEIALLLATVAALVAGGSRTWQRSLVTAFTVAAFLAAVQQIASFAFLVAVGHSLWNSFPFGGTHLLSVDRALASDTVAGIRDNNIPTFIMLPALAHSIYRRTRTDVVVAAMIIVGTLASLSRSMWAAAALTIAISLLASVCSGHVRRPSRTARLGIVVASVALLVGIFGSQVLGARIKQSGSASDTSLSGRKSETASALDAILRSPASTLLGAGAGVILNTPPAALRDVNNAERLRTPILENEALARWTNFGILSVIGTIALLIWPAIFAFRALATRARADADLMALGLALPAILAVGPVAGTLLQLNVSLPFWMLAATILAAKRQLAAESPHFGRHRAPAPREVPPSQGRPAPVQAKESPEPQQRVSA